MPSPRLPGNRSILRLMSMECDPVNRTEIFFNSPVSTKYFIPFSQFFTDDISSRNIYFRSKLNANDQSKYIFIISKSSFSLSMRSQVQYKMLLESLTSDSRFFIKSLTNVVFPTWRGPRNVYIRSLSNEISFFIRGCHWICAA